MKNKFELILDNSKKVTIINRENGLYQIYKNIYLTETTKIDLERSIKTLDISNYFVDNLAKLLEDLYDNNEFEIFNLYFLT